MGIVIYDTFTEASNTALTSHTPDTGTSWTEEYNTSGSTIIRVNGANDQAEATVYEANVGIIVIANPGTSNADVDVEVTLNAIKTSGGNDIYLLARYQDTSNFYALRLQPDTQSNYAELLVVSGGAYTSIVTATPGLAASDVWKLELRGTTIKGYRDSGAGYVEVLSGTNSDISAAGEGGLAWGDVGPVGGSISADWKLDNFTVTEGVSAADAIAISDTATVNIETGGNTVLKTDSIGVSDSATVSVQTAGVIAISITDSIGVSDSLNPQLSPLHISQTDAITVAESVTVAVPTTPVDTDTGADDYTLLITDGDWETHLTHGTSGWILLGNDGWGPVTAQFKGNGYYSAGSMADGNQLRYTAFNNVTESLRCMLNFTEDQTDDMINQIDMLDELLKVKAPRYWTDRRSHKPVWLKKQMKGETGATYSLINQGRVVRTRPVACTQCRSS
jgi:hypothetical protein